MNKHYGIIRISRIQRIGDSCIEVARPLAPRLLGVIRNVCRPELREHQEDKRYVRELHVKTAVRWKQHEWRGIFRVSIFFGGKCWNLYIIGEKEKRFYFGTRYSLGGNTSTWPFQ